MDKYSNYGAFLNVRIPGEIKVYFYEVWKGPPDIEMDDNSISLDKNCLILYKRNNKGALSLLEVRDFKSHDTSKPIIKRLVGELLKELGRETELYVAFWLNNGNLNSRMTISNRPDLEDKVFSYYHG